MRHCLQKEGGMHHFILPNGVRIPSQFTHWNPSRHNSAYSNRRANSNHLNQKGVRCVACDFALAWLFQSALEQLVKHECTVLNHAHALAKCRVWKLYCPSRKCVEQAASSMEYTILLASTLVCYRKHTPREFTQSNPKSKTTVRTK